MPPALSRRQQKILYVLFGSLRFLLHVDIEGIEEVWSFDDRLLRKIPDILDGENVLG